MGKIKIIILDTNVILHDGGCLHSFQENDIVIPLEVITELDNFKVGLNDINYNVRNAIRVISSMPREQIYNGGASRGEGLGKLRINLGYDYHEAVAKKFQQNYENGKPIIDHSILNTAYCLGLEEKLKDETTEVILVTKDLNLQLKAGALHIQAEDYKNDLVENAHSYYEKAKEVKIDGPSIDTLYEKKEVDYNGKIKLYENEYVILKSSASKTALAIHYDGKLHLIVKDSLVAFGIKPRNSEQAFAMHAALNINFKLVTFSGKAGTGKTLIALAAAFKMLKDGIVDQVIYSRNIVPVGKDIGFLPGDEKEKINPYMGAFTDNIAIICNASGNSSYIASRMQDGKIFTTATSLVRGRSFTKTLFIIDEAQNLTPHEAKTIITRSGEDTKIIMMGDVTQIDIAELTESSNGLVTVISKMKRQKIVASVVLVRGERSYLAELAGNLL